MTVGRSADIVTARLRLTPLTERDAPEMVGVLSDTELYRYTGGEPPDLVELSSRYRALAAGSGRSDEIWHNWIIRLDQAAIGFVQATQEATHSDLAWVVGTPWQGRGYATEAAGAMKTWLAEQGVAAFSAHIHPDHEASMRVARSIGLAPSGDVDDDGEQIWR